MGKENNNSPVVRLKGTAKEFNFSNLRPDPGNKLANSGETMFLDFHRMNFVINGRKIDKSLIIALQEGATHRKSELFNSDIIYSDEISNNKGKREIDTEHGKAFVASILKDLEEELVSKKDYRSFAKEIFKEILEYAGAKVSSKIIDEFITSFNQAGLEAAPFIQTQLALGESFIVGSPQKVINIDCTDQNNVRIRSDMKLPILSIKDNMHGDKICDLPSSLEFTLECGKDGVTYRDGEMSLIVPEKLKNYKYNGKNLFDIIKEYFETFCTKLGFKFETEIQIKHDLGPSLKVLDNTISTTGSHANEKFIELLSEDLRERLLGSGVALEDVNDFVKIRVSTVMDLLSDYVELDDNEENRELLTNEVADNLGLSTQDKTASEVLEELSPLPSLIKGPVDHNQVEFVAKIFANLIIEGKSEVYQEKGAINAIDAIHQKVSNAIVKQENKVKNNTWTQRIEEQNSSKSHEHLH